MNRRTVTLHGGIGDGRTVTIEAGRLWFCFVQGTGKRGALGGEIVEHDTYAPTADGTWRVIDRDHQFAKADRAR